MGEGQYTVRVTIKTMTGTRQDGIGADPRRVGLMISSDNASPSFSVILCGQSGGESAFFATFSSFLSFKYSEHGPIVSARWDVGTGGPAGNIYFTELLDLRV